MGTVARVDLLRVARGRAPVPGRDTRGAVATGDVVVGFVVVAAEAAGPRRPALVPWEWIARA